MKRFDYLAPRFEPLLGLTIPTLSPSLRLPLCGILVAVAFVGLVWGVQDARLRAVDRENATYADRLARTEIDLARVRLLSTDLARLRALARAIEQVRESGPDWANDLAALGNDVPADAWLTSIRVGPHELGIEGRGTRLDVVGTTLAALTRLPAYRRARLIDVHGDALRRDVTYTLALESAR